MLTLLELVRASLHDDKTSGVTCQGVDRHGGIRNGKRRHGPAGSPEAGPRFRSLVATAIVVADMVGVGVFTSLGFQVKDIPSGFSILLLWTVGGVVALCGVFSYSELGAMFPRSSGEYNFLSRAFHPAFGFLAGWVSATVGFAAPVALAAMAFGEYGKSVLPDAPPLALADRRGLAGVDRAARRRQALQHLSIDLDHPEGRADRRLPGRGICHRHAAAGLVHAVGIRLRPYRQRAVRDRTGVRDVFVLRAGTRRPTSSARCARRSRTCRARCWRGR